MPLEKALIKENVELSNDYYMLVVEVKNIESSKAGQFFMLKPPLDSRVVKIPVSLHCEKENILEFYYQLIGDGTRSLVKLKQGDEIEIQGPLGNSFDTTVKNRNLVLIGGGVGIAPMKKLIEELDSSNNITFIAGSRDKPSAQIIDRFSDFKSIKKIVMSDDGSVGEKGNTADALKKLLEKEQVDIIYTCGPPIMMKVISGIAKEHGIRCQVSLEERMACGVNVCRGCSIETKSGMKTVCHDGPVFESESVY